MNICILEILLIVVLNQSRAENIFDFSKQNDTDSIFRDTRLRIVNTTRNFSELSNISTYESVKNSDGAVQTLSHITNSTYYKCTQFGDDKAGEFKNEKNN